MTAQELAVVRDLQARLRIADERIEQLEREVSFLRARHKPDPLQIRRLHGRLYKQKLRADLWKHRALAREAA